MATVINIKKSELKKIGYDSLVEWLEDPDHIYIGRNMSFYVNGAFASKWQNPYTLKKYTIEESLKLYEKHVKESGLINDIFELNGKVLGCWCKPDKCHGDVLQKILKKYLDENESEDS